MTTKTQPESIEDKLRDIFDREFLVTIDPIILKDGSQRFRKTYSGNNVTVDIIIAAIVELVSTHYIPKQELSRLLEDARKAERKKLTWEKIDKKILESDGIKLEFQVKLRDKCSGEHYCVFTKSDEAWGVAIDGHNIISHGVDGVPPSHNKQILKIEEK